jgi:hypothetical protein
MDIARLAHVLRERPIRERIGEGWSANQVLSLTAAIWSEFGCTPRPWIVPSSEGVIFVTRVEWICTDRRFDRPVKYLGELPQNS